ncbi:hypothetical protein Ais01nite_66890 [Asanoa ishikariensis]|uniref:Uncharacterized protein n=1 Tax=Asanoa ishikariensis TaxID=137265 RepID=A0A1H3NFF7_9ACTN|nr:hypothetical protein [Asanoa ishikariensis]GIF68654.1 hypothetical protein Ais01nite_66890 [Asanoa ishikariensis]SDY87626.1 hypothetical protein SAMN05421684_2037 [Asanoa ishikariensis]
MPASEKFTVDLSPGGVPDLDLGGNRASRRSKSTPQRGLDRAAQSTKGGRGKPAAQPKRYAFRRA